MTERERENELNVKIWWETQAHLFLIKPKPDISFKAAISKGNLLTKRQTKENQMDLIEWMPSSLGHNQVGLLRYTTKNMGTWKARAQNLDFVSRNFGN